MENHRLELFYQFCQESSWNDSSAEIKEIFKEIYKIELLVIWNSWLNEISALDFESS
ncbi:MAG: hypothetical protein L3J41_15615 [Melioribacteraceae bacterium]|nr:hypothetical protein [Melioribacteraceae bacterium]